jgi:hypothetical protein
MANPSKSASHTAALHRLKPGFQDHRFLICRWPAPDGTDYKLDWAPPSRRTLHAASSDQALKQNMVTLHNRSMNLARLGAGDPAAGHRLHRGAASRCRTRPRLATSWAVLATLEMRLVEDSVQPAPLKTTTARCLGAERF